MLLTKALNIRANQLSHFGSVALLKTPGHGSFCRGQVFFIIASLALGFRW